jgi:acyl-CoA thioester hydrolase
LNNDSRLTTHDSRPFTISWRVRFNEVDLQGVVHHTQIVTYLEIARLEFWRSLGISYRRMRDDGHEFIVHRLNVEYIRPVLFDEVICVAVRVESMGRASFVLGYEIMKEDGRLAVTADIELVCARNGIARPVALPAEYRDKLLSQSGS